MSLLQLSPEAVRLRRVAKACAAGEMSRLEYRQARREMIRHCSGVYQAPSEPTLTRYRVDKTQRRDELFPHGNSATVRKHSAAWLMGFVALVLSAIISLWMFLIP